MRRHGGIVIGPIELPIGVRVVACDDAQRAAFGLVEAIAKEYEYDINRLAEALKAREANSGRKVVRMPPREVALVRKTS
ncbi:hypothetical protein [Sorangium sp. So ce1153]|uniref:hypothetical protein n=1 Tax=Sorangium sp. So ce1153 TaxID=3133333 RepID=UPI003F5D8D8C